MGSSQLIGGKSQTLILVAVACVCFILLVCLMVSLIKKYGVSVRKGHRKSRQEVIGYNPSKVSKAAATCALGCFVCGIMVAMTPFNRRDF